MKFRTWWCGRCKEFVKYKEWRLYDAKPCGCTKSPSPWWYVPTTFLEKIACKLHVCQLKGTCIVCDNGPKI